MANAKNTEACAESLERDEIGSFPILFAGQVWEFFRDGKWIPGLLVEYCYDAGWPWWVCINLYTGEPFHIRKYCWSPWNLSIDVPRVRLL